MRPGHQWSFTVNGELHVSILDKTVPCWPEEELVKAYIRQADKPKVFIRPVRVWVAAFPSMMCRETTPEEQAEHEGDKWIVGA